MGTYCACGLLGHTIKNCLKTKKRNENMKFMVKKGNKKAMIAAWSDSEQ